MTNWATLSTLNYQKIYNEDKCRIRIIYLVLLILLTMIQCSDVHLRANAASLAILERNQWKENKKEQRDCSPAPDHPCSGWPLRCWPGLLVLPQSFTMLPPSFLHSSPLKWVALRSHRVPAISRPTKSAASFVSESWMSMQWWVRVSHIHQVVTSFVLIKSGPWLVTKLSFLKQYNSIPYI